MSEFQSDIKDRVFDEEGNELDKHGFRLRTYPNGVESVRKSVENCEQLAGLDRKLMQEIIKGEFTQYETSNSVGRQSKKIVIEYDIKQKDDSK